MVDLGILPLRSQAAVLEPANALHLARVAFMCYCIGDMGHATSFLRSAAELPVGGQIAQGLLEDLLATTTPAATSAIVPPMLPS